MLRFVGAVEKTRTSTGFNSHSDLNAARLPFRHDRMYEPQHKYWLSNNKSLWLGQACKALHCNKNHANKWGMVEWKIENSLLGYDDAVSGMEKRVADIRNLQDNELVWLVEHPPLYTAGTSADDGDLLDARFPVFKTGRGGEYTYHGPGQRVGYVMLDLKKRQAKPDIKHYVWQLEEWIIQTLAEFGVQGERRDGRVGIWVVMPDGGESKIAAIGVRIRRWVTYHGIAINVSPDLSHFSGIVPCGISQHGVTSLYDLGIECDMSDVDAALQKTWHTVFT